MNRCPTSEELAVYSLRRGSRDWHGQVEKHLSTCAECRSELASLERLDVMIKETCRGKAPDLWPDIAPHLVPRKSTWLAAAFPTLMHRAGAAAVAAGAIALLLVQFVGRQPVTRTESVRLEHSDSHITMTWSDPFADRASLAVVDSEIGKRK